MWYVSAGVGRTGTYIVLETMMKCVDDGCDVNIYKFVSDIRSQRNMMVQTEVLISAIQWRKEHIILIAVAVILK